MSNEKPFWPQPAHSKLDLMTEARHSHLIKRCLKDEKTQIGLNGTDRYTYVVYDDQEAVLIRPISFLLYITLELFRIFKSNTQQS